MDDPKVSRRPRPGGAAQPVLPHQLQELREITDQLSHVVANLAAEQQSRVVTEGDVRLIIQARRVRESCFGPSMFSDPAWDILLCLFAAKLGGKRLSITTLGECTAVPFSTALRWINELERERWLVRETDQTDKRRVWVAISDRGYSTMRVYFDTIGQLVIGH